MLHWGLVLALAANLATGLRIAADSPAAGISLALAPLLPQGDVFLWHLGSGVLVLGITLAYIQYQALTGLGRRFLTARRSGTGPRVLWRRVNLISYWAAFGLLVLAIVTGSMQYLGLAPVTRSSIEMLHGVAAWGLVLFAIVHVALQLAAGGARGLLAMLLTRLRCGKAGALAAAGAGVLVLVLVAADRAALATLTIAKTGEAPVLDGRVDDPAWQRAQPVRVRLSNGANLAGGETRVTVRGVHDERHVYLLCQWTDPTRSQKHVPLVKTSNGWRILQTAYRRADENRFYEDKLALMLATANPLAALTSVHLGEQPLPDQPGAPGGRGLHYTTSGRILDIWHWKSVRNGAQHQADDNYFGPPLPAPAQTPRLRDSDSGAWLPRYTAGYRKDPPGTFSGYEMNWEYFDEGETRPLRLPEDPRDLAHLGRAELSPDRSDEGRWWIEFNDTRPYAEGTDNLPVGTLLPSVLPTGRITGDRGDVRARGHWTKGRWHLELSRRIDTGSDKDVPIADGTLLWLAVFDHTQTRHAYHLRPLRVRLDP